MGVPIYRYGTHQETQTVRSHSVGAIFADQPDYFRSAWLYSGLRELGSRFPRRVGVPRAMGVCCVFCKHTIT
jgi:hypothetical protein